MLIGNVCVCANGQDNSEIVNVTDVHVDFELL